MENKSSSISNFKRFLLRILIPVLCCLLVLGFIVDKVFVNWVVFDTQAGGAYKVHRIIASEYPDETPMFGSSRCLRSFVPSILGEGYFNYGIEGTQDKVWLYFLSQELAKPGKTTPVIINFDQDGLSGNIGDELNYIPSISQSDDVKKLLGDKYHWMHQVPFARFYGHYDLYMKYYMDEKIPSDETVDSGGRFISTKINDKKRTAKLATIEKRTGFNNDPKLLKQLEDLLGTTKRKVCIVITPSCLLPSGKYYEKDKVDQFLKGLADEYGHVYIFDYSNVYMDSKYFFNLTHLNYNGAKEFSKKFKTNLKSAFSTGRQYNKYQ